MPPVADLTIVVLLPHHRACALANDRGGGDEPLVRLGHKQCAVTPAGRVVAIIDHVSCAGECARRMQQDCIGGCFGNLADRGVESPDRLLWIKNPRLTSTQSSERMSGIAIES